MRVACLLIPNLPLHAELRASPELRDQPLVITAGQGPRAEILCASEQASQRGVRPGLTLPQARSVCPEIEVRIASPVLERTARETLLDLALSLSPRAELGERASGLFASEGLVYLDASGIQALHGSESAFLSILQARAERAGFVGFACLASSRAVTRLAARHLALSAHLARAARPTSPREATDKSDEEVETSLILSPQHELDFLAPLPLDLLDPNDRTAQALTRLGIHRIRDLLRLSRRDLAARLGPELLELVAQARGEADEPPLPEPRTTALEEGQDLEAPIQELGALAFVFRGLVARLTERLSLRALGCVELRLTLELENGALDSRRIGVASACQDEGTLLRLLRQNAEKNPPKAAIEGIRLLSEGVPLRREQLDLFLPRGPSPSELDQTLAELGSICGTERIGAPEVLDDHRPGAFGLQPFLGRGHRRSQRSSSSRRPNRNPGPPRGRRQGPRSGKTQIRASEGARSRPPPPAARLTLRALRPPIRAEVRLEQGRPASLRCALSRGKIIALAGPWRTTGYWWSKSAHFAIDHYDLQMSDGAVLRLGYDWTTKRWQVDGLYD